MSPSERVHTILFIDDDEDLINALSVALEHAGGFQVRHALDGEEGLRMAQQSRPDLIILDIMMPGKDGFETGMELSKIDRLRDVPILVLTAFGENIGVLHGMDGVEWPFNVKGFIEKPVEFNVFLQQISSVL